MADATDATVWDARFVRWEFRRITRYVSGGGLSGERLENNLQFPRALSWGK